MLAEAEREESELPEVIAAIRLLLLLTGCRSGEIVALLNGENSGKVVPVR